MDFRSLITLLEMTEVEATNVFIRNGVNPTRLNDQELKSEYRKLMKKNHPDRGGDAEIAKQISSAYDVFKKLENSRSKYATPEPETKPEPKENFNDISYVKHYFEKLSEGKAAQQWTISNFDGHFFRGMITVKATHEMFSEMARVMRIWDRFYDSSAILVGTRSMMEKGNMYIIDVLGEEVSPIITLQYNSPNMNPANDRSFTESLPKIISAIRDGSFVSQNMLD
jgi:hypothetical protein